MAIGSASYKGTSPYVNTGLFDGKFLDLLNYRTLPAESDDIYTAISSTYHHRPDLMSYDLYGTSDYWWVFIVRNRDVLIDPIWDFTESTYIYIPKLTTIRQSLG